MPLSHYSGSNSKMSHKKAIQLEEDKKLEIEKQNVLLFNKMMKIMKRNDANQPAYYARNIHTGQQR